MTGEPIPPLWHYTCDHGRDGIGDTGFLLPGATVKPEALGWPARLSWMTDITYPNTFALGLANLSGLVKCDRVKHRYRITDTADVMWWPRAVRSLGLQRVRSDLESVPGCLPAHWYVATAAVPVEVDWNYCHTPAQR